MSTLISLRRRVIGSNRRLFRYVLVILVAVLCLVTVRRLSLPNGTVDRHQATRPLQPNEPTKAIVLAKMKRDRVSWVHSLSPSWTPYIYTMERRPEPGYLTPRGPVTRGRESLAYLTYLVDHYDTLPDYVAFVHSLDYQYHNDVLSPYTTHILQNLRWATVDRDGFVNLRCSTTPGCPVSVAPHEPSAVDVATGDIRAHFAGIYAHLFNVTVEEVPKHVGGVCCAQFVVTRERVRKRPRADYVRMLEWAAVGSVEVTTGYWVGWLFEQVWHVVFGMESVHCPGEAQCRCDLLGWCGEEPPERYKELLGRRHIWLGTGVGDWFWKPMVVWPKKKRPADGWGRSE